jgi:hypothetical protein
MPTGAEVAQAIGQALEEATRVLSWQVLVLVGLGLLALPGSPRRLGALLKPFRSIKVAGAEFVLAEAGAADAVNTNIGGTLVNLRGQVQAEFDRQVRAHRLRDLLQVVVKDVTGGSGRTLPSDVRWTIHVPDVLFEGALYQLLDYYPDRNGRGRAFSVRFGFAGRAWRHQEDQVQGKVTPHPNALISDWGMTQEEAERAGRGRQSFLCVCLREPKSNVLVGILYADSEAKDAFGSNGSEESEIIRLAARACRDRGLCELLGRVSTAMAERSPLLSPDAL